MQLKDLARLIEPVDSFAAGSIGRIVGRCIDERSYILEFSRHSRVEVAASMVEAAESDAEAMPIIN